jgi:hypothetical protein
VVVTTPVLFPRSAASDRRTEVLDRILKGTNTRFMTLVTPELLDHRIRPREPVADVSPDASDNEAQAVLRHAIELSVELSGGQSVSVPTLATDRRDK